MLETKLNLKFSGRRGKKTLTRENVSTLVVNAEQAISSQVIIDNLDRTKEPYKRREDPQVTVISDNEVIFSGSFTAFTDKLRE